MENGNLGNRCGLESEKTINAAAKKKSGRFDMPVLLLLFGACLFQLIGHRGIEAAEFCIGSAEEMEFALEEALKNNESDILKIVAGSDVGDFIPASEIGASIAIEGGYSHDCRQRLFRPERKPFQRSRDSGPSGPRQSTAGPEPPYGAVQGSETLASEILAAGGQMTVVGVPVYAWRHGCGPTALGMILGYYDAMGIGSLFDGDASSQTEAVNQAIASQRTSEDQGHYEDYSEPVDEYHNLLPDRSEAPEGDEHADDSIADFMKTSFSSEGNRYGWSWSSDIAPAFLGYVASRCPDCCARSLLHHFDYQATWETLKTEIDNGRPMVCLVDTDADGATDHFVAVVGYRESPPQYGCLDTWFPYGEVIWHDFGPMEKGRGWGVWGGWSFSLARGLLVDRIETIDNEVFRVDGSLTILEGGLLEILSSGAIAICPCGGD